MKDAYPILDANSMVVEKGRIYKDCNSENDFKWECLVNDPRPNEIAFTDTVFSTFVFAGHFLSILENGRQFYNIEEVINYKNNHHK